jgi:predicted ATP-binding protein involved in virulence
MSSSSNSFISLFQNCFQSTTVRRPKKRAPLRPIADSEMVSKFKDSTQTSVSATSALSRPSSLADSQIADCHRTKKATAESRRVATVNYSSIRCIGIGPHNQKYTCIFVFRIYDREDMGNCRTSS